MSDATTRSPLEELIRDEIRRQGSIPFRRFMDLALYHPQWGYYRREEDPFGAAGDYFTSSQLQPVFGRLLAQQIGRWREELGCPAEFAVVELGPGRGEAGAVLRDSLPGLRWIGVEDAAKLPEGITGVIASNEFFDALPVHSIEKRGGGFVEHHVCLEGDRFRWVDAELSDPRIADYLKRYAAGLAEGQRLEVNLAALDHLERIAAALRRGWVLTIDYGYTAREVAAGRRFPQGSLMSYRKHQAFDDVLSEPGRRDITAHVNFTALEERGEELGLASEGLRTQGQFLIDIGEADQFEAALRPTGEAESLQLRMQLKMLLFGMGETFRVLLQSKAGAGG